MKKRLLFSLCIGGVLSAIAIYFSFRNVPFGDLLGYLHTINYWWIFPAMLLIALAFVLRALRWQIILSAVSPMDFSMSYHPLTIGFMLNTILPGRLGEVARPLILKRKRDVSFATGIATVAAERIFDAGFLVIFLAIALRTLPMDTALDITYGSHHLNGETLKLLGSNLLRISVVLVVAVFLLALDATRNAITRCIDRTPEFLLFFLPPGYRRWVRTSISGPINRSVHRLSDGLLLFKSPMKLLSCTGVTLLVWLLSALSYQVLARGCPEMSLSLFEYTLVMVVVCFFIALPSVPGYWGIWEAGGIFALSLFNVPSQAAAGFTLANHAVQLFPVFAMGLVSAFSISVNFRRLTDLTHPD